MKALFPVWKKLARKGRRFAAIQAYWNMLTPDERPSPSEIASIVETYMHKHRVIFFTF